MEATSDATKLPRCFFIYDQKNENEEESHRILYFYPTEAEQNRQYFLMGCCVGMLILAKMFTPEITIMNMERSKLAFKKEEGDVIFAITGDMTDTDESLQNQLSLLSRAFTFFNGPIGIIVQVITNSDDVESFVGRQHELLDEVGKLGACLIPLFHHLQNNLIKTFGLLPHIKSAPVIIAS